MRCACWRESSPSANTVIDIVGIILTPQNVMQGNDALYNIIWFSFKAQIKHQEAGYGIMDAYCSRLFAL